jgi:carbon-monoxide dehydrogenase medium subunit
MYAANFDYYRPTTVAEAIELLRQHEDAKVLAGGHSLLPTMKLRASVPPVLVDIGRIQGLADIQATATGLRIGAMTTHATIAASDVVKARCPILAETAAQIGDIQVRNRGTIGGSLAHADPAAELPVVAVALGARLRLVGNAGERWLEAREFYTGLFATALEDGEILAEVELPPPPPRTGSAFLELARRHGDYAQAGVAAVVTLGSDGRIAAARLVYLGVGDGPLVAARAAGLLAGEAPGAEPFATAARVAAEQEISPTDDIHAGAGYKRHLAAVLTRRALATAAERARQSAEAAP